MPIKLKPFIKINGLYTIGCEVFVFSDDPNFKYQIRVIASSEEMPNEFAIEATCKAGRGDLDIQLTNNKYYYFVRCEREYRLNDRIAIYKYKLTNEVSDCIFEYHSNNE